MTDVPTYQHYHIFTGTMGNTASFIGSAADHKFGVEYIARWQNPDDGFAVHGRRVALALAGAGVPVHLAGLGPSFADDIDKKVLAKVQPLIDCSIERLCVRIHHLLPHEGVPEQLLTRDLVATRGAISFEEQTALNRHRILSTVFEQRKVTLRRAASLARFGAIWVANQQDARMLVTAGVPDEQVTVVPIPYDVDEGLLELRKRPRRPGAVRFYHIGKWEPRKDQHSIIGGFLRAFHPGEAYLYLKTSEGSPNFGSSMPFYPSSPAESLRIWLTDPAVLDHGWTVDLVKRYCYLIRGQKSRAQIIDLHRNCDVYVTCSHGEGYDLPAFEAKLVGNAMVYTSSGGPQQFATDADQGVPLKGEEPVHPWYRWGSGATWGAHHVGDIVDAMSEARRRVHVDRAGECGMDPSPFSPECVGAVAKKSIDDLLIRLGAPTDWAAVPEASDGR